MKFGSEQFVATSDHVFFPLQWVGRSSSSLSPSIKTITRQVKDGWLPFKKRRITVVFHSFQTRVCVSLEPKSSAVKLVVDGETIVNEVRKNYDHHNIDNEHEKL